mgnify:FL=1
MSNSKHRPKLVRRTRGKGRPVKRISTNHPREVLETETATVDANGNVEIRFTAEAIATRQKPGKTPTNASFASQTPHLKAREEPDASKSE